MREQAMSESRFWRRFTQFVRFVGVTCCTLGIVMLLGAAWDLLKGRSVPRSAALAPTSDLVAGLVGGVFTVAIGLALLRVRPYRPDLGDRPFGPATAWQRAQARAWWTGDRIEGHDTP